MFTVTRTGETGKRCSRCDESDPEKFSPSSKYECRACNKHRRDTRRAAWYQWLQDTFDLKCSKCGYDKHFSALDFHHIKPNTKEQGLDLSRLQVISCNTSNILKVQAEIDKCIILCANCHRVEHCAYDDRLGE